MERTMSKYTKQFKIDAVELLERSGKTVTAIAEDLGIPRYALSRWRQEYQKGKFNSVLGKTNSPEVELIKLKKEIADIKLERDILKKALAIFSKTENK
jgi:transposase